MCWTAFSNDGNVMPPRGFQPLPVFAPEYAMQQFIHAMYLDTIAPEYPQPSNRKLTERNQAIIEAYENGETLERIAAMFDISTARAHQIVMNQ
jgi:DNA-binding NarL/FixJ family response regulator